MKKNRRGKGVERGRSCYSGVHVGHGLYAKVAWSRDLWGVREALCGRALQAGE